MTTPRRVQRTSRDVVCPSGAFDDAPADQGASPTPALLRGRGLGTHNGTAFDPPAITALSMIRAGLGATHLLVPDLAARVLVSQRLDERARSVVRVLGARQVVQAVLTGARPSEVVLALGAGVDALHAASMVTLGLFDRRRRRVALVDALIASGFASAGFAIILARRAGGRRG